MLKNQELEMKTGAEAAVCREPQGTPLLHSRFSKTTKRIFSKKPKWIPSTTTHPLSHPFRARQILTMPNKPMKYSWKKLLLAAAAASVGVYYCHGQRDAATKPATVNVLADAGKFRSSLSVDDSPVKRNEPMKKSYADILEKVEPAVVKISTYQTVQLQHRPYYQDLNNQLLRQLMGIPERPRGRTEQKEVATGLGSGIIVNKEGYVITNNHVIERASKIKVRVSGRDQELDAEKIAVDPEQDIAVLRIKGDNLPVATLADSSQVRRGDLVFAVGDPFGYEQSASRGIISSVGQRSVGVIGDGQETVIQTDAAVNPGNSGGPLVDAEGRVIGINTAIFSNTGSTAGIGFALPINRVLQVAARLVGNDSVGQSGYLGVKTEDVTPEIAKILELPSPSGALVSEVQPNSPALQAGILQDDVILELQGRKLENRQQLVEEIQNFPAGREVNLGIWRTRQRIELKVKLGDLVTAARQGGQQPAAEQPAEEPGDAFGLRLTKLTEEWRVQLGLSELAEGVIVDAVTPNSSADRVGLRRGDLITRVNAKEVVGVREAQEAMQAKLSEGIAMVNIYREGRTARAVLEARR